MYHGGSSLDWKSGEYSCILCKLAFYMILFRILCKTVGKWTQILWQTFLL